MVGRLPIFREEDLKATLDALGPYFCKGRCVQIEADAAKRQAEWDALSEEEKKKHWDDLRQMVQRLSEYLEKEASHAHQAGDV